MNNPHLYNEKDILHRIAEGHEASFRQLFDQYHQRIYSFAFFLTRSDNLAEEITQEIFIKVWTHRSELKEINYFKSWLKTLIRNQAFSYLRRIAHEKLILEDIGYRAEQDAPLTENDVLQNEYSRLLQQAIAALPSQQKKVYLLSRQAGLKHEAIAEQMNISIHTVKNHMKAALHSIRLFLDSRTDILILLALTLSFKK